MRALIIEDETLAARHLQSVLNEIGNFQVIAVLDSIITTIEWFETNPHPDLVFMDIHLADGSAFKIFEHINITCPIIFATAYDEYAVKAFKVNSVDYLLKPVTREAVERALDKLKRLTGGTVEQTDIRQLIASLTKEKLYKTHFLVSVKGSKLIPLVAQDIAYILIEDGLVKAKTNDGKSYIFEYTLDELSGMLNPSVFFRANRQFIISRNAIKEVDFYFNNRLSVNLKVPVQEKILISKVRVSEFREWFSGGI
ncbi:MAG: response regulator transcription factor [Mariniphaga sp.]|nr:response regulator transcription factor [Mariniphaga sp.]